MSDSGTRRGLARADVIMALGAVALMASIGYPPLRQWMFHERLARVVSGVEGFRDAAKRYLEQNGHWPDNPESGSVPADLVPLLPQDLALDGADGRITWSSWDVVETPPQGATPAPEILDSPPPAAPLPGAPPSAATPGADTLAVPPRSVSELGAITVHTSDERILAALLDRYGTATSFVRDSTWTLVLGPPTRS